MTFVSLPNGHPNLLLENYSTLQSVHTLLTRVLLLSQTSCLSHTHLNVEGTIINPMWIMLHNLHKEFDSHNGTVMGGKITRECQLAQNGNRRGIAQGYAIDAVKDFLFKG